MLSFTLGPIVRYSPNGIIFSDPNMLAVAYGRRADKSDFFAPNFDTHSTFTRKYYEEHVPSKKAIAEAASRTSQLVLLPSVPRWP